MFFNPGLFNNLHLWIYLRLFQKGGYIMIQCFPESTDCKNSISWDTHYHLLELELFSHMGNASFGYQPGFFVDPLCCFISISLSVSLSLPPPLPFFFFLHFPFSSFMTTINRRTMPRHSYLFKSFPYNLSESVMDFLKSLLFHYKRIHTDQKKIVAWEKSRQWWTCIISHL